MRALNLFFPNVWKLSTVRREKLLIRELFQVPVTTKHRSEPAPGLKRQSTQTVSERGCSEMEINDYINASSQHSPSTPPRFLQAPQQLCLFLCALFLWITVFCSLQNVPYVLGHAVDLAWCPNAFADGQKCFILIKKGLRMQKHQFSRKREENTWWNGNNPPFLKDKRCA